MTKRSKDSTTLPGMTPIADAPPDVLGIPHSRPFVCALTVDRSQLSSTIQHVSNIEFVKCLDRLAELHGDSLGHTRGRLLEQGQMWFVARHEIDYLAEAWLGDELRLATWVRQMGRVKAWRESVIWREADESVVCRATTLWVLVNLESRRPTRISESVMHSFNPLEPQWRSAAKESPCTSA